MQKTIVVICLVLTLAYAAWRVYQAISNPNDQCKGCKLKDNCTLQKKCEKKP